MRKKFWITFGLIAVLVVLAILADLPQGPNIKLGSWYKELYVHEGLDLRGGTHLVYNLDLSKIDQKSKSQATEGVKNVIERRINGLGVSEPVIQSATIGGKDALIIELPGITDVNEAINLIGKTAQLSFLEQVGDAIKGGWAKTDLNGSHLVRADAEFSQNSGSPEVAIQFNDDGKKIFAQLTQKNLQKPIAIQLDDQVISAPTVQTVIDDGKAVITGKFTIAEAKTLALELNSGALPVPINIIEQRNIGATLGADAVKKSLVAGMIGLTLVALFMIVFYRLPGLLAVGALIVYTLISLAIFKLIPITLTLAGIAGFILSIGMAVDANILIFERMKEELKEGKTKQTAVEEGFKRAWLSVRDSNFSSIITCLILIWLGSGLVRGFAVTLIIGILISMFTAITVTRTFLRLAIK